MVITDLEQLIKKHLHDAPDKQPKNFTEIATILGIGGFIRPNQLEKILSWYNNKESNREERAKEEMYGKLINYARNYKSGDVMKKKIANKSKRMTDHVTGAEHGSQTNSAGLQKRNVDRMNNVSSGGRASITPADSKTNTKEMVTEQVNRMKFLMNY